MRIIGIDPGTWRTGVGLIEAQGSQYKLIHSEVITQAETASISKRLLKIYQSLEQIISGFKPEVLALENIFYSKNVKSMLKIGEARACAMLAAASLGLDVIEYPPSSVKQSVTGNGHASKEQIQAMIKALLKLNQAPRPDAADALAVAICHANHHRPGLALAKKSLLETENQKLGRKISLVVKGR